MRKWNYLRVSLLPACCDKASELLCSLGTLGIEELHLRSGTILIKAYFDFSSNIRALQNEFRSQCSQAGIRFLSCSCKIEKERDWFKQSREQLTPFDVGAKFRVIPVDRKQFLADPQRIPIYIEPGMAFGTGSHETTQLCLEALERYLSPGGTCLDVGTGSGILAIAAAKLGARKIIACDLDPIALKVATSNGNKNRCASRIRWVLGEVEKVGRLKMDCVVANLTLEIIEEAFSQFERRLKPNSCLILSGILRDQAPRVEQSRLKGLLELVSQNTKGEWACMIYSSKT